MAKAQEDQREGGTHQDHQRKLYQGGGFFWF